MYLLNVFLIMSSTSLCKNLLLIGGRNFKVDFFFLRHVVHFTPIIGSLDFSRLLMGFCWRKLHPEIDRRDERGLGDENVIRNFSLVNVLFVGSIVQRALRQFIKMDSRVFSLSIRERVEGQVVRSIDTARRGSSIFFFFFVYSSTQKVDQSIDEK